mgnify:FL=1
MNEFDFINKYFKPLVSKEARNLNDDAAIFRPKIKNEIVISTDSLVEGIHFFGHENPSDIAKKSLRVNLSDMAAMGAKPLFYNLALNIPKHKVQKFIPKFVNGLKEDQDTFNLKLIGGDLTSSLKHINITITIFGEIPQGQFLPRGGAKNGDLLFVSGFLGLSKIGLDNFFSKSNQFKSARNKYLLPEPRVDLSILLRKIANCMIDISDGLVQDATHLAEKSNLSVEIDIKKIPLPNFKSLTHEIILNSALYGGDDYELLFSCDPCHEEFLKKLSLKTKINLTKIGFFKNNKGKFLKFKNTKIKPKRNSFSHF